MSKLKQYIGYFNNGSNLDHIPCGNAWKIIKLLDLQHKNKCQIGVGLNLPSQKMGLKDLIKIENKVFSTVEIDMVSVFCVGSTFSVIKDFQVVSKTIIPIPEVISHIIVCPNKFCVSKESESKFYTFYDLYNEINLSCHYCSKEFLLSEVINYNI